MRCRSRQHGVVHQLQGCISPERSHVLSNVDHLGHVTTSQLQHRCSPLGLLESFGVTGFDALDHVLQLLAGLLNRFVELLRISSVHEPLHGQVHVTDVDAVVGQAGTDQVAGVLVHPQQSHQVVFQGGYVYVSRDAFSRCLRDLVGGVVDR